MRHKPKHLSYNYNKITQWFVKPRLVLSSVCLLLTLPVDLFIFLRGQVNVLRDLCRAEMRSTGPFCAFTSAADKVATHQELLLRSPRKAEAGRRGQPHITISKKFSPDNQSKETKPKSGICS